jgi:hypothetical protein
LVSLSGSRQSLNFYKITVEVIEVMDFAPARQRQGVVDKEGIKVHADDAEDNRAIKHTSEDSVIATTALPADWVLCQR